MFIFSILLNAKTLQQVSSIVHAACILLGSKTNSVKVAESLAIIMSESQKLTSTEKEEVDKEHQQQGNPDHVMKEDIFDSSNQALSKSPFKDHFDQIRHSAMQEIQTSSSTGTNNYHGETVLNKLFTFLPTIAIWSDLLSGDLKRFSKNYDVQINQCKKSTAISEAIFKNIKVIMLKNEKHRMDEFIDKMHKFYVKSAITFCNKATYSKSQKEQVHNPPPEEGWGKKGDLPKQLQPGSYQHRPPLNSKIFSQNDSSSASVPDKTKPQNTGIEKDNVTCTRICKFENEESNCWLNATLQSILHPQVVQDKLKNLKASSMVQMSAMPQHLAALIEVFLKSPGHTFDGTTINAVTTSK